MASTRIAKYDLSVSQQTTATDTIYEISGDDAAAFHAELIELKVVPSELIEDKFTVARSYLTDALMDMPYLQALDRELAKAASQQAADTERESIYDKEIAPELRRLSERCQAAGISFVAAAEWATEHGARTTTLQPDASPYIRVVYYAANSKGNADDLITQLMRDGEKHGHSSAYLSLLKSGPKS